MKSLQNLMVLLTSLCVFIKACECDQLTIQRRNAKVLRDQQTASRLDENILRIDERLEKMSTILAGLDDKISKINDKLFNEKHGDEAELPINVRHVLWEEKISELNRKLSQLINQSDERFYDAKSGTDNGPVRVRLPENAKPLELEIISQQMKDSLEKINQNFSEKLDKLSRCLQTNFDETAKKNLSRPDEILMQIQRKERRIADHTSLINEILTTLKNQLRSEEEVDTKTNRGSLTKMVSSFENMKSSTLTQRNKTTSYSRKGGIIFPNVKNKPAKINTTFTTESFDIKDFKVSWIFGGALSFIDDRVNLFRDFRVLS